MSGTQDSGSYRYGNDKIGYHDTRHEAVGAAAIRARKDPFPFGEDFEHRDPESRRRDILRRCSFIYVKDAESVDFCDFCSRNFPEHRLTTVYTVMNDIEQKERACPDCEDEAREHEKPVRTDGGTAVSSGSVVAELAGETLDWMAEEPTREDVADEVWAFTLATYIDGVAVTPLGYDVTETLASDTCAWCYGELTDEPAGSTLCRDCFFGPTEEYVPWLQRLKSRLRRALHTDSDRAREGDA